MQCQRHPASFEDFPMFTQLVAPTALAVWVFLTMRQSFAFLVSVMTQALA